MRKAEWLLPNARHATTSSTWRRSLTGRLLAVAGRYNGTNLRVNGQFAYNEIEKRWADDTTLWNTGGDIDGLTERVSNSNLLSTIV